MRNLVCFLLFVAIWDQSWSFLNSDLPMQNPDLFEGDILGIEDPQDRNAVPDDSMLWPEGIIPYKIDSSLNSQKDLIQRAMDHIMSKTCVKFVPYTNEQDYVSIFLGNGCYSNVGKTGRSQGLSLGGGCHVFGTVVHELLHAVGFYHEQNRSDRDDYLNIFWQNIEPGMEDQFTKLLPSQNRLLAPFDFESIMLYGQKAFSKDGIVKTMTPKRIIDFRKMKDVHQKPGMSDSDVLRANTLYKCPVA